MATKPALMAQSNGVRFALSQMLQRAPWSYPHQSQHKERVKVAIFLLEAFPCLLSDYTP
jgi:hypothetical protein